jgi:hypothetical protein
VLRVTFCKLPVASELIALRQVGLGKRPLGGCRTVKSAQTAKAV